MEDNFAPVKASAVLYTDPNINELKIPRISAEDFSIKLSEISQKRDFTMADVISACIPEFMILTVPQCQRKTSIINQSKNINRDQQSETEKQSY